MLRPLKNIYHWLTSWFFVMAYGFPSRRLKIIGVTGTDGKTTTAHLIYDILNKSGFKVALISTVAAYIGDQELDTGFHVTNPDARLLQKLLKKIADAGMEYVVLEVTSHGLHQSRLTGVAFEIGIVTNITHEHLDYHKTFDNYRQTKARLLANTQYSMLNQDDPSFDFLKSKTSGRVIPFSQTKLEMTNRALPGTYNKYNVGAAEAAARVLGVSESTIQKAIKEFTGVPGRMEEIRTGQKFRAVVDFAHTPNALENVLKELATQLPKGKKLIVVFGCAGLRDHTKRSKMGEIATRIANKVIVTAEDPRTENLETIYQQVTSTLSQDQLVRVAREDDRQKAIQRAVDMAKPGDIVVATGKGHEKSMCFGKKEYPWSDREAFEKALAK